MRQLIPEWTLVEQYNYGWVVPLLAIYLFRMRSENCPAMRPSPPRSLMIGALLVIAMAEMLVAPLREANADWRLLGWLLSGLAALATMLAFAQAGGWAWMKHFVFPVLFFFTAVPWPHPIESDILQWLMQKNALVSAEILHWAGIEAQVKGNLIRLNAATVGIDEACSGIRSLQGSLMSTLFIGEIFKLSSIRRLGLLIVGAACAMATNIGRMIFLSWMTYQGGREAHERWHDTAGFWVLAACVAGVTFVGWLWRSRDFAARVPGGASGWAENLVTCKTRLSALGVAGMLSCLAIGASMIGTEWWYSSHEREVTPTVNWSFRQPSAASGYEPISQPSRVRGDLRYDGYSGARWHDSAGMHWVALYFQWNAGRNSVQTILVHDPRVCLAGSGMELVETLPVQVHTVADLRMPFDAYWFRDEGANVFVFNCVLEDVHRGQSQVSSSTALNLSTRISAVCEGKRNLGQRRLEIAVWGASDAAAACVGLHKVLDRQLAIEPPTS